MERTLLKMKVESNRLQRNLVIAKRVTNILINRNQIITTVDNVKFNPKIFTVVTRLKLTVTVEASHVDQ